jgi:hypothetical protein
MENGSVLCLHVRREGKVGIIVVVFTIVIIIIIIIVVVIVVFM